MKRALVGLLVMVLGLTVTPARAEAPERRLVTLEVPSGLVDPASYGGALKGAPRGLRVNVLLPAGYDDHPERRYPVLWLLHGANGGYADFVSSGTRIDGVLADVPAVIVMPDGGLYGMYSDWYAEGSPDWASYHLDQLLPLIENRFRIRPGRKWHAIAGISMGGQGALRYASFRPDYFGSVAGLSAAVPDTRGLEVPVGLAALVGANGAGRLVLSSDIWGPPTGDYAKANSPAYLVDRLKDTRVYLISGNGVPCAADPPTPTLPLDVITEADIRLQQIAYAKKLRQAGAEVTDRRPPCGVHTFGVWDRAFLDIVRTWGFFR
jgi:S-formylglutathione hydrolase FrmB